MKKRLIEILDSLHKYNTNDMAMLVFGLDKSVTYDAIVVAPSYSPYKLKIDEQAKVTLLHAGQLNSGYLIEKDGLKIAWIITGSNDANMIDNMTLCAELKFKKIIFVGSVGALRHEFEIGDICTPSYSIAGGNGLSYLNDSIKDFTPFERVEPADKKYIDEIIKESSTNGIEIKKASIFCTNSIGGEYFHLEEIKSFGTDLIEMETAAFYRMAELFEIPSIALLVVSDNSATGNALLGRSEEQTIKYNKGRMEILPKLIFDIAK